jgi:hypothetical protein
VRAIAGIIGELRSLFSPLSSGTLLKPSAKARMCVGPRCGLTSLIVTVFVCDSAAGFTMAYRRRRRWQ